MTLGGGESVDIKEIMEDIPTVQARKRKHSPTEQQQTNVKTLRYICKLSNYY